ncbi:hypothetical protein FMM74_020830 [Lachnospiraceae bacterium MD308]|nr:hypothetical protein [Lachnospiraceae bacterium MD308]
MLFFCFRDLTGEQIGFSIYYVNPVFWMRRVSWRTRWQRDLGKGERLMFRAEASVIYDLKVK